MNKDIKENEIMTYDPEAKYAVSDRLKPYKVSSHGRIQTETKYGEIDFQKRPSHAIHHQFVS